MRRLTIIMVILIALAGGYLIVPDLIDWIRFRPPANLVLFVKACQHMGRSIEAKFGLGGLFTSATAVFGERNTYQVSNIKELDYNAGLNPHYSYWYAVNGVPTAVPGSSQAKAPCDLTMPPTSVKVAASATGFIAAAKGMIDEDGSCDEWSINEVRELKRTYGIQERDWIGANTLLLKTHVTAGCSDSIKKHGANYKVDGQKLILEYRVDECTGMCAACDCDFGVTYKISNLAKKHYDVEVRRLN